MSATWPRKCGIASFGDSLAASLRTLGHTVVTRPIRADAATLADPQPMDTHLIHRTDGPEHYRQLGISIGLDRADVVIVQHEYGLFGGRYGCHLLETLQAIDSPTVVVLHTVLPDPDADLRHVTTQICRLSSLVTVMCDDARDVLVRDYDVEMGKVTVIPHGFLSSRSSSPPEQMVGDDRSGPAFVSIGLLGANKGLDLAVRAMSRFRQMSGVGTYYIVGQTHPDQLRGGIDPLRTELRSVIDGVGIVDDVVFVDEYVTATDYAAWIQHADAVLIPFTDLRQVSSGTLAHARGLGTPALCSPFVAAVAASHDDPRVRIIDPVTSDTMAAAMLECLDGQPRSRAPTREEHGPPDWLEVAGMYVVACSRCRADGD